MKFLVLVPDFRNQYISNLILELKKSGKSIDYFSYSLVLKSFFQKKTIIVSDRISLSIVLLILFELIKFNKLNVWLILWNGERDKKIFPYFFLRRFQLAINLKFFEPFYPNILNSNFLPISIPTLDNTIDDSYFNDKIVFIGELFENLNDILLNNDFDSQSWLFANKIFFGNEQIENINNIFEVNSYEEWVTINRIRYLFLKQLSKDFSNLILVGDDFLKFNFPNVLPTNHSYFFRHCVFKSSLLNIDFLSKSTFAPVYPRSIECISLNPNFLQLSTNIFENIFGFDNSSLHTFRSYVELKSKIDCQIGKNDFFWKSTLQNKLKNLLNKSKDELFVKN